MIRAALVTVAALMSAVAASAAPQQSPAPYYAPWQTDFLRYPIALVNASPTAFANQVEWTVPTGVYWRIVSMNAIWRSVNPGETFTAKVQVNDPNGLEMYEMPFPAQVVTNSVNRLAAGPNLTTFVQGLASPALAQVLELPDIVLQPGSTIFFIISGVLAGDNISAAFVLFEQYVTASQVQLPEQPIVVAPLIA